VQQRVNWSEYGESETKRGIRRAWGSGLNPGCRGWYIKRSPSEVKVSTVKYCTCFGCLCERNHTIVVKLAELGTWPKGCQKSSLK
jgi:hypothetical protein